MADSNSILPPGLEHLALQSSGQNKKAGNDLGQSDFLELMLTQIKHQDPLNPAEGGEFLSQLAQFGTVNGITQLQSAFNALASSLQSSQALQASTMVGRSVLVSGNTGVLEDGGKLSGAVDMPVSAADLSVLIHDSAGQLVRKLNLGTQPAGLTRFEWDGLNESGNPVPSGSYRIIAQASAGNEVVTQRTLIQGKVDSVTLARNGGDTLLNLHDLGTVLINDVREIL